MAINLMGHFTAVGMRAKIEDPTGVVINTCGQNDTSDRGDMYSWVWSNPTNRAIQHVHPNDPTITAVSVECMWQGTKIFVPGGTPDQQTLQGNWRRGKAKRPIGAWNGPNQPLLTSAGAARENIYIPCFKALIEHWMRDQHVAGWVQEAKLHKGNIYLRDFDTGRGIYQGGPMSHAWLLCTWLNTGVWGKEL